MLDGNLKNGKIVFEGVQENYGSKRLLEGLTSEGSNPGSRNIDQLRSEGYIPTSNNLHAYFHNHPEERGRYTRFDPDPGRGFAGRAFTAHDFFGSETDVLYYDRERKEAIEEYLTNLFLTRNPSPSRAMKMVFTKLLHDQSLHWRECKHMKRPGGVTGGEEKPRSYITPEELEKFRNLTDSQKSNSVV